MGPKISFFNIIYYAVTLGLFRLGREDPSSSLGYGIMIVIFWIVALVFSNCFAADKVFSPKVFHSKSGHFYANTCVIFDCRHFNGKF